MRRTRLTPAQTAYIMRHYNSEMEDDKYFVNRAGDRVKRIRNHCRRASLVDKGLLDYDGSKTVNGHIYVGRVVASRNANRLYQGRISGVAVELFSSELAKRVHKHITDAILMETEKAIPEREN